MVSSSSFVLHDLAVDGGERRGKSFRKFGQLADEPRNLSTPRQQVGQGVPATKVPKYLHCHAGIEGLAPEVTDPVVRVEDAVEGEPSAARAMAVCSGLASTFAKPWPANTISSVSRASGFAGVADSLGRLEDGAYDGPSRARLPASRSVLASAAGALDAVHTCLCLTASSCAASKL